MTRVLQNISDAPAPRPPHAVRGRQVVLGLSILLPLLSGSAGLIAQTTEPDLSTGTTTAAPAPDWDAYAERAAGFRKAMLQSRNALEHARHAQKKLSEDMKSNRKDCRSSLRRANRDSRFRVLRNCYGRELQLLRNILQAEEEEFAAMPGTDAFLRMLADDRRALLMDALSTVREAVDAGVFVSEQDLLEAKRNLWIRYQEPYAIAVMRLRADAFRTWVAHIQLRIRDLQDVAEEDPQRHHLVACWAGLDRDLTALATAQTYADLANGLRQAESAARECMSRIPPA